jgi:hypothetical protein
MTGWSEDGGDLDNESNDEFKGDNNERDGEYKEDDNKEDCMAASNNNSFSFSAVEQEQLTVADDYGGQLDVAVDMASGRWASDGNQLAVLAELAEKCKVGELLLPRRWGRGDRKEAVPLLCCLKPQGRSLPDIWTTVRKMDFHSETWCDDDASDLDWVGAEGATKWAEGASTYNWCWSERARIPALLWRNGDFAQGCLCAKAAHECHDDGNVEQK